MENKMNTNEFVQKVQMAILAVFSVFVMSSAGWAATYYVDATNGNDSNTGTSEAASWKTIAKVNVSSFEPGNYILFKRGEMWRETLIPSSSGTNGSPIIFATYGSGNSPIINGANLISGWIAHDTHLWKAVVTTQPYHVFFNKSKGNKETSVGAIDAEYDWYWNSNVLYVYSSSDPETVYTSPGIEAGARQWCIFVNAKNYITLENIDTKYSGAISSDSDNILIRRSNHITVRGGTTSYSFQDGIMIISESSNCIITNVTAHHNGDSTNEGNGIAVFNESADNNTIAGCTTHNNQGDGIVFHGDDISDYDGPDNGKVSYCKAYRNGEQGIEIYMATNCIVEYNEAYENGQVQISNGQGIKLASIEEKRNVGNVVRYNYCHDNLYTGISTYKDDWFEIYYNIIASNAGYGVAISDYNGGKVLNNTIYNSGKTGIVFQTATISNAELKNNLIDSSQWGTGIRLYSNAVGKVTSDYNAVSDTYFGRVDASSYNFSDWKNATSQDGNSIAADPQLVAPTDSNFRLNSTSPCIDAGVPVGLNKDFEGTSVPKDHGIDIGAYEHKGIAPITNLRFVTPQ